MKVVERLEERVKGIDVRSMTNGPFHLQMLVLVHDNFKVVVNSICYHPTLGPPSEKMNLDSFSHYCFKIWLCGFFLAKSQIRWFCRKTRILKPLSDNLSLHGLITFCTCSLPGLGWSFTTTDLSSFCNDQNKLIISRWYPRLALNNFLRYHSDQSQIQDHARCCYTWLHQPISSKDLQAFPLFHGQSILSTSWV